MTSPTDGSKKIQNHTIIHNMVIYIQCHYVNMKKAKGITTKKDKDINKSS